MAGDRRRDRPSSPALSDLGNVASTEREYLEAKLEHLHQEQVGGLERIADTKAQDLRAVVGKLAAAVSATREDGGHVHDIIMDAPRVLVREASTKI